MYLRIVGPHHDSDQIINKLYFCLVAVLSECQSFDVCHKNTRTWHAFRTQLLSGQGVVAVCDYHRSRGSLIEGFQASPFIKYVVLILKLLPVLVSTSTLSTAPLVHCDVQMDSDRHEGLCSRDTLECWRGTQIPAWSCKEFFQRDTDRTASDLYCRVRVVFPFVYPREGKSPRYSLREAEVPLTCRSTLLQDSSLSPSLYCILKSAEGDGLEGCQWRMKENPQAPECHTNVYLECEWN